MEGYLGWTEETVDKNEPEICTRWEKSAPMGVLEEQWMSSMSPGNEEHFFKCPDPKCKEIRTEATRVLHQCLQRCKTELLLQGIILQKVQQYTGLAPRTELEIDDNDICIAIYCQEAIGWHNFLLG
jgi:hypothetical protein